MEEKKPYRVGATPILHNGKRHEPDALIHLTDEEADSLDDLSQVSSDDSKTTKKGGKA
ncbi:hypothetical protein RSSE_c3283 [Ralstonia solanacearum]|nr:hypothetical protein RSSE_c3283 [Ralstonia solanacearum]